MRSIVAFIVKIGIAKKLLPAGQTEKNKVKLDFPDLTTLDSGECHHREEEELGQCHQRTAVSTADRTPPPATVW